MTDNVFSEFHQEVDFFLKNKRKSLFFLFFSMVCLVIFFFICYTDKDISDIPLPTPLLFFASWVYLVVFMFYFIHIYGKRSGLKITKHLLFWTIILFIASSLNWHWVNAYSYYDGLKRGVHREAKSLRNLLEEQIKSGIPIEDACKNIFNRSRTLAIIDVSILSGNGNIIKEIPLYSFKHIDKTHTSKKYIVENAEYNNHGVDDIIYNNNTYRIKYQYIGRPKIFTGLWRAFTFSSFEFSEYNNYYKYRLYNRSWNFWIPFFILSLILFSVMFQWISSSKKLIFSLKEINIKNGELEEKNIELDRYSNELEKRNQEINKKNEELKDKNIALDKSVNKLKIFEGTYNKILRDFSDTINENGNNLQHVQSRWDEFEKKSTSMKRHDIINEWRSFKNCNLENIDSTFVTSVYMEFLEPTISKIHSGLKGLEKILDLRTKTYTLGQLLPMFQDRTEDVKTAIPVFDHVKFSKEVNIKGYENFTVIIIYEKLQSIIFNLLSNSQEAIFHYFDYLDENDLDCLAYKGRIFLNISVVHDNNFPQLCIDVADNGGGFSDDKVNIIYKEPVSTSKVGDQRHYGEATSYIGFFVMLMHGSISASNITFNNGEKGARTIVRIPISAPED